MVRLERSDLRENVTAYAAQLSGEPRTILVPFVNVSERLTFNASFHGLVYGVGLLLQQGRSWSRPVRTVTLLTSKTFSCSHTMSCLTTFGSCDSPLCSAPTEPLPVRSAHISDYKESPETGVVFHIEPPPGTVFSRVNISYTEGQERRAMLYKGAAAPGGGVENCTHLYCNSC